MKTLRAALCAVLLAWFAAASVAFAADPPAGKPHALVLEDPALPDDEPGLNAALRKTLTEAGYNATAISVDALRVPDALAPDRCALLVLPGARRLPALLIAPVEAYTKRGGNLIVLGAPAWQSSATVLRDGHWRTAEADASAGALTSPPTSFLDFTPRFPVEQLIRGANHPEIATKTELVSTGSGGVSGALHVVIPNLDGWDMWRTPDLPRSPFAPGETVTVLSARGGPRTRRLALEWNEKDGSRWIAVIPLTEKWKQYRLTPTDFHPWGVAPERERSGFHPENAVRFVVGLAFTHTGNIGGQHEYWIAGVGSERAASDEGKAPPIPALETIAPAYKFSTVHGPLRLTTPPEAALVSAARWGEVDPAAMGLVASPPRATGAGFHKGRSWRWQPLLAARDAGTGQWRGAPAALFLHRPEEGTPSAGGVWASFAIADPAFYRDTATQKMIGEAARRMRIGVYLLEGGANAYTLLPGQKIQLGATVANLSTVRHPVQVRVTVAAPKLGAPPLWQRTWEVTPEARRCGETTAAEWTPSGSVPAEGCVVTCELRDGAEVVDRVQHRLFVWAPPTRPQFISAGSDGHFHLGGAGALWRACGVNYTPSSGIAQENDDLYQRWLDPAAYDPESAERDLYHIEEMGFNAVSIWAYGGEGAWQNLLDFLRRCRAHHLRVSLMLSPDVPSPSAADNLRPLIEKFRLPENDTIFAYEIAWEPEFNGHDARRGMDGEWEKWIVARYGSLSEAERAWGVAAPRENGKLTNPPDDALARSDGPQARLAVDYRRFLDDWLVDRYGPIVKRLHQIDPHRAVSFRMNHAGDPTNRGGMPYAFEGAARAVDFLAPEAYGRVGDWERVKPGWFTTAYARAVAPTKPVVWVEVGVSVWDAALVAPDPQLLEFQGRFYDDFFRMATASGADGLLFWWFPGGYRFGEGSDYGLLHPDGTDRPATAAVRRNAHAFLTAPAPTVPDVWLSFDRNAHPDGIVGVYDALAARFWEAIAQGRRPGLRVAAPN